MKQLVLALSLFAAAPAFAAIQTPILGRVVCSAQNARGGVFKEIGLLAPIVQAKALAVCRAKSVSCRALGCRPL